MKSPSLSRLRCSQNLPQQQLMKSPSLSRLRCSKNLPQQQQLMKSPPNSSQPPQRSSQSHRLEKQARMQAR